MRLLLPLFAGVLGPHTPCVHCSQSTKLGKAQAHRRRVNALRRKLAEAEVAKAGLEEEMEAVRAPLACALCFPVRMFSPWGYCSVVFVRKAFSARDFARPSCFSTQTTTSLFCAYAVPSCLCAISS